MDEIHLPPELYHDLESSRFRVWSDLRGRLGSLWGGRKKRNEDPEPRDPRIGNPATKDR